MERRERGEEVTDQQLTIIATAVNAGIPTLAVLIGILVNNRQVESISREFEAKFDGLRRELDARFAAIDARFAVVDARFNSLERIFTERLLRVEEVIDARLKHLEER
jgi:hypothetical protein